MEVSQHRQVAEQLQNVEAAMRNLRLWHQQPPTEAQLASAEPFCVDTMDFPQWLRFVFIEKLWVMVEAEHPLPERSNIAAMAEVYFSNTPHRAGDLVTYLRQLDEILTKGNF